MNIGAEMEVDAPPDDAVRLLTNTLEHAPGAWRRIGRFWDTVCERCNKRLGINGDATLHPTSRYFCNPARPQSSQIGVVTIEFTRNELDRLLSHVQHAEHSMRGIANGTTRPADGWAAKQAEDAGHFAAMIVAALVDHTDRKQREHSPPAPPTWNDDH